MAWTNTLQYRAGDLMKWLKILRWALVIVWMAVIFAFSAQDAVASTQVSDSVIKVFFVQLGLSWDLMSVIVRKTAHIGCYLLLALLVRWAFTDAKHPWIWIVTLCMAYAASDEIHQWFVPGRAMLFQDWLIDGVGVACGCLLFRLGQMIRKKHAF